MNKLDIIIIIILSLTFIRGLMRGIVKEVMGIVGIVLAFILSSKYHQDLTPYIVKIVHDKEISGIIAFAILFLSTVVVLFLIGALIREMLKSMSLGWLDNLGGGVFGFIKGVLLSSMIIFVLTFSLDPKSPILTESKLSPYVMKIADRLIYLVPEDIKKEFKKRSHRLKDKWEKSVLYKLRHPELNK